MLIGEKEQSALYPRIDDSFAGGKGIKVANTVIMARGNINDRTVCLSVFFGFISSASNVKGFYLLASKFNHGVVKKIFPYGLFSRFFIFSGVRGSEPILHSLSRQSGHSISGSHRQSSDLSSSSALRHSALHSQCPAIFFVPLHVGHTV